MFFLWPDVLWFSILLPLLPVAYVWLLRRRSRAALRYSSLSVVRGAAATRAWRRHLPPALFLLALAGLMFAAARPAARVPLPWARSSIFLAIDVSLSMRVDDVKPTRLAAAQEAAKSFLRELPQHIEVGLVTFAASSQVVQRATLDRDALYASIDGFQMQMGTAVGNAIVMCLSELFPDQGIELDDLGFAVMPRGRSLDQKEKKERKEHKEFTPVAPGSFNSAAIILLSDGRRTTGVDTLEAAKMAADRGVRIYVIGLGTVDGDVNTPEGLAIYMRLDEPTLREVARMTDGEYHHAGTAEALRNVYKNLGSRVQVLTRETELTGVVTFFSAVLAIAAGVLSFVWFGRGG